MAANLEKLVEELSTLSVLEAADLVKPGTSGKYVSPCRVEIFRKYPRKGGYAQTLLAGIRVIIYFLKYPSVLVVKCK